MVAVGTNMSYDNAYYYLKPDNTVISILVILLFQASLLTTTKQAGIQLSLVFPCVSWQAQLSQGPPLHLADEATLVCHTCSCISSVVSCGDSLNTSPISAIISLGIFWHHSSCHLPPWSPHGTTSNETMPIGLSPKFAECLDCFHHSSSHIYATLIATWNMSVASCHKNTPRQTCV